MNWNLTSEKFPESNKNQVLVQVICESDGTGTEKYANMVLIPPEKKGGVWYTMNNANPDESIEIPNERIKAWCNIIPLNEGERTTEIDWQDDFPERIWKYCSYSNAIRIITESTLYFSLPADFNDPFDCSLEGLYFDTSKAEAAVKVEMNKIQEMAISKYGNPMLDHEFSAFYEHAQKGKVASSVVTCFSLNENNALMWAHYGEKHTGLCFEFDSSMDFEEIYPEMKFLAQGVVIYDWPDKVNYCADKRKGIAKIFLHKNIEWSYEEEIRFVCCNKPGAYKFPKRFIKGVVFGLRVSDETIKEVIALCKENELIDVKFRKAIRNGMKIDLIDLTH